MKRMPARGGASKGERGLLLLVEEESWRREEAALRLIRRAARRAVAIPPQGQPEKARRERPRSVTILLTDDEAMRRLNATFRGRNRPTNVLSFPAPPGHGAALGDIAMGYGVVAREARAQSKSLAGHAAHLAVHGILHLLGYDHEKPGEARMMEAIETKLLADLGLPDPYAPRPYARRGKAA